MLNSSNGRAHMEFSPDELKRLQAKVRFKVCYHIGFASPDVDDIVQETFKRLLQAMETDKIRSPEAIGAFLNGVCQNVIFEFRRRFYREEPMPEVVPEPPVRALPPAKLFEMQDTIAATMSQLSARDQQVLRAFYLEERPVEEILAVTGLSTANFRVVLSRAKDRFRHVYLQG